MATSGSKAIKPDLIYCAISGFGQDGPLRLNPAYDQIIQGLSGVMSVTGDAQSAPLRVGYPVADTMGGITAAYAISAALFRRERTGEGEFIDVSMLESTLGRDGLGRFQLADRGRAAAGARKREHDRESLRHVPHRRGPSEHRRQPAAAVRDAVQAHRPAGACRPIRALPAARIASAIAFELNQEIEQALAARSAAEWSSLMNDSGVPAGEVLDVPSVLEHPQVVERGLLHTFKDVPNVDDDVSVVRSGFRLKSGDPRPASPPPALGADTASLLAELGYSEGEIEELSRDKAI